MPDYLIRIALQNLAVALPLFIVWIVGIVMAIVHWKKSPRKSIFSIIACVLLPIGLILEIAWNVYGIHWLQTSRSGFRFARPLSIIIPLFFTLLRTTAWVFVLLAIFGKSKTKLPADQAVEKLPENQDSLEDKPQ